MTSLNGKAEQFIQEVLCLQPRIAVFDCDGTLWSGDSGQGFFYWEMDRGLVSPEVAAWARPRYAEYMAGKVDEDTMCGEMVTMHRGLAEADVIRAAEEYFDQNCAGSIFPEMRELLQRLQAAGSQIWVVSSTNEWVIRASTRHLGLPPDRVIAAAVKVNDGRVTDQLLRVPSGDGKPIGIREMVKKTPDAAFGNSRWDAAMLHMAGRGFAVNPNPDLEQLARERGWTVYFPQTSPAK